MEQFKSKVAKIDKVIVKIIKSISYISGVCLIGIMLVATINVIGEKLRSLGLPLSGIPASTEIVQYLHIPVVFLAVAYVTLDRGHTKIDLLSSKFPGAIQRITNTIANVLGILISGFISQRGFVQMGKFIARKQMSNVTGFGFPLWPFVFIFAVGFGFLSFSFLWSIIRQFTLDEYKLEGDN